MIVFQAYLLYSSKSNIFTFTLWIVYLQNIYSPAAAIYMKSLDNHFNTIKKLKYKENMTYFRS